MGKSVEAAKELLKDPLGFMQNNMVFPYVRKKKSGAVSMMLDDDDWTVWLPNGTQTKGYILRDGDYGEGCFEAYWCAYDQDKTHSVMVGPERDLMFTPDMDGCCLGVGSPTQNGSRLVSHSNAAKLGGVVGDGLTTLLGANKEATVYLVGRTIQQAQQIEMLKREHGGDQGLEVIGPWDYRTSMLPGEKKELVSSTTFGVRDRKTGHWAFYVQKRIRTSGPKTLLGGVVFVAGSDPSMYQSNKNCILF